MEYINGVTTTVIKLLSGMDASNQSKQTGKLSKREVEILQHISDGISDKDIAVKLGLSINTIRTHRKNILSRSGVSNMIIVVKSALHKRWIH